MPSVELPAVTVVGGGLAGCEAALQLARFGIRVRLIEMRPEVRTPAHRGDGLAEIVCSNSLKSTAPATGSGLLKDELDLFGCRLLECARETSVPAGAALAVDRDDFSARVADRIADEPMIEISREEVSELPLRDGEHWLVATGPLTSPALVEELGRITGQPALHFFDAIAPTVTLDSLDLDNLYRAARYDRGEADYLNSALDRTSYESFYTALMEAEKADVHAFDRNELFEGCQPLEEIAASGPKSLAFGPLRPVGLHDPVTGERAHAVIQLRQENREGTLYGLVGFQTRLKYGEQKRVFRMIPGLANAEFVRYGQMHRNFYLDTPRCSSWDFSLKDRPDVWIAGQITGVEGYVESMTSGLVTAWRLAARIHDIELPGLPLESMTGALLRNFLFDKTTEKLTPMNVNFGLVPDLVTPTRGKRERKIAKSERAVAALAEWLCREPVLRLLAATPG
ncbi:MAG: methylenetetrahydrofolate--tRNA-(uracil(54)-C(5))-methyltransferase (FADH(2)-oxidizing) TrmFO [Candidatus Krumholzibacteria bacterium]|nr:methylenetetrahydrofolate--tRNA-(uracil(54)-C(5))-methyltransferase (FADH(2)-oxidizing) TrmFO [Candidatus Krumholzibacteria bacterium]